MQAQDSAILTIVLGTFRNTKLIRPTVEAIRNQTFTNFRLIIVDDNELNDVEIINEVRTIIESFADDRITYEKNTLNIGVPFVYRKWINLINTKYFMIVAEGDVLYPSALEEFVNFLEKNPEASMVHGCEDQIFPDGRILQTKVFENSQLVDSRLYLDSHFNLGSLSWSQAVAMFKTEFFKIKNIPILNLHFWDFSFHCYYLAYSKKIGYLAKSYARRMVTSENIQTSYFRRSIETRYQALKFIEDNRCFLADRNISVDIPRFKNSILLLRSALRLKSFKQHQFALSFAAASLLRLAFEKILAWTFFFPKLILQALLGAKV